MKHKSLTSREAGLRLKKYGANVLESKKKTSALKIFFDQFKDFMVLILIICTVVSAVMEEMTEAIAIVSIVILNAIMGFIQEYKTEQTMNALRSLAAPVSKVLRDREVKTIPASELVPGDIFFIEQGDRIPADGKILETHAMTVDESLLTGESVPVDKRVSGKVAMGTMVKQGRAVCEVTATGMHTEMGKIANLLQESKEDSTPLQKRLAQLGKYIIIGCLLICALVTVTGVIRGEGLLNMLLSGISLAVAAVPEGLPAIVTIALALGVQRMVKRNALARKLPAIETLGCATVICSDKTGTLTENKMEVRKVFLTAEGLKDCPESGSGKTSPINFQLKTLNMLIDIAAYCNNSTIKDGDPTEVALLNMVQAKKPGYLNRKTDKRIHEIPFDPDRKCMSVIIERRNGEKYLFTKGAPDIILKKCNKYLHSKGIVPFKNDRQAYIRVLSANDEMGRMALRVLGFAYKKIEDKDLNIPAEISADYYEKDLIFVGLVGMIDPPRKEAENSVKKCRRAGIKTCMITGDHKTTAVAIAKEIGILQPGDQVMTGEDMDKMSPEDLDLAIHKTTVFARVMPKHKITIVKSFKKAGHVVAMTGDGVNDAPAVKEADIGVAMGKGGTDVTREAADMVLMDDNFATIVSAIEEGRTIYSNIRKFLRYLLSCNIGEVITMFVAILIGLPLPLIPIQILWVNLVTDGLPAIALGLEPGEKDIMNKKPRKPNESIFSDGLVSLIVIRGIMIGLCTLIVFTTLYYMYYDIARARTAAFATLVFSQLIHVFECKSEHKSFFEIPLFNNSFLIIAVLISSGMLLAAVYLPPLQNIFRTVGLHQADWFLIMGFSLLGPFVSSVYSGFRRLVGRIRARMRRQGA